eukprot:5749579-Pyramimonas_sp.AAC.1
MACRGLRGAPFGTLLCCLAALRGCPGILLGRPGEIGPFWDILGCLLGPSWGSLGRLLGLLG